MKILIAEDDERQLQNFSSFITKETNFEVAMATNGKDTIDKYLKLKPDVLFLDLDMPNINGLGVLKNLKSQNDKRNIIVTSQSKELISNLYDFSNIYRLMPKPFQYDQAIKSAKEIYQKNTLVSSKETIKNILSKLGFNPSASGTSHFIELIFIKYQRRNKKLSLKDLYKIVSTDAGLLTSTSIKWSIENALSSAKRFIDRDLLYSIFDDYNPAFEITISYLSDLIVNYLKRINKG